MNCEEIFDKTEEYLNGELSEYEMQAFSAHLSVCEECRKSVEMAEKLNSVMRNDMQAAVPDDFLDKLHERIQAEGNKKTSFGVKLYRRWQPYTAMAACVVLAIIIGTNAHHTLNSSMDYLVTETAVPSDSAAHTLSDTADYGEKNKGTSENSTASVEVDNDESGAVNEVQPINTEESQVSADSAAAQNMPQSSEKTKVSEISETPNRQRSMVSSENAASSDNADSAQKASISAAEIPMTEEKKSQEYTQTEPQNLSKNQSGYVQNDVNTNVSVNENTALKASIDGEATNDEPIKYKQAQTALMSESVAEKARPTTDVFVQSAPQQCSPNVAASGGSGGAAIAAFGVFDLRSAQVNDNVNVIDIKYRDKVQELLKRIDITKSDDEYIATQKQFDEFSEELKKLGIDFDGAFAVDGENVRFKISFE